MTTLELNGFKTYY